MEYISYTLDTFIVYMLALLHMMDEIGQISLKDALKEFERRHQKYIPAKDKKLGAKGRVKWELQVEWARNDLVALGLMGSGGRGIWTITEKGRDWIRSHPNGRDELLELDREYRSQYHNVNGEGQLNATKINWKGKTYSITREELMEKARGLLAKGTPPEATRYQDWYAEVDGQRVSVKWLFHLITGAGYLTFMSNQACNTLKRLGIPTYNQNKSENSAPSRQSLRQTSNFSGLTIVLNNADRAKFFHEIKRLLPEKLPAFAQHCKIRPAGSNYLQIAYPELIRSHYELRFGRSEELAFHFEAVKLDVNLARLEYVKPFEDVWKSQLGQELRLEKRGKLWAQISLEWHPEQIHNVDSHWKDDVVAELPSLPQNDAIAEALKSSALRNLSSPLWQVKAHAYADLLARFIEVTLPELQNAFPPIRRRRKKTAVLHHGAGGPDEHAHRFFDEKIAEMRHFLEGRSIATPSHEVLCDWIQLCYFFGLFEEGHKIFPYVNELELNNDWLYRRTKKYAGVCRLNAARRS